MWCSLAMADDNKAAAVLSVAKDWQGKICWDDWKLQCGVSTCICKIFHLCCGAFVHPRCINQELIGGIVLYIICNGVNIIVYTEFPGLFEGLGQMIPHFEHNLSTGRCFTG